MKRAKPILIVGGGLVLVIFTYIFALPIFVQWEERATTKGEHVRRVKLRNSIYALVIWLKAHDPTGGIRTLVLWQYELAHDPKFDVDSLPMK